MSPGRGAPRSRRSNGRKPEQRPPRDSRPQRGDASERRRPGRCARAKASQVAARPGTQGRRRRAGGHVGRGPFASQEAARGHSHHRRRRASPGAGAPAATGARAGAAPPATGARPAPRRSGSRPAPRRAPRPGARPGDAQSRPGAGDPARPARPRRRPGHLAPPPHGAPGLLRGRLRPGSHARPDAEGLRPRHRRPPRRGPRHLPQLPAHRAALPAGPRLLPRRQDHRGRHLPPEPGGRGRRRPHRRRPAHHPRQRLRDRGGGRSPSRLHGERPLLRPVPGRGHRLRRRPRRPRSPPDVDHRRPRGPDARGPGPGAARGALRRAPGLHHRARGLRGHAAPRRRAGPLRPASRARGDLQDPPLHRCGARLRAAPLVGHAPGRPPVPVEGARRRRPRGPGPLQRPPGRPRRAGPRWRGAFRRHAPRRAAHPPPRRRRGGGRRRRDARRAGPDRPAAAQDGRADADGAAGPAALPRAAAQEAPGRSLGAGLLRRRPSAPPDDGAGHGAGRRGARPMGRGGRNRATEAAGRRSTPRFSTRRPRSPAPARPAAAAPAAAATEGAAPEGEARSRRRRRGGRRRGRRGQGGAGEAPSAPPASPGAP